MKISEQRMGEIALKVLIRKMAQEKEIPTAELLKRGVPDEAKKLGIPLEEARAFIMEILPRVIGARLGCSQVSLVWEGEEFHVE